MASIEESNLPRLEKIEVVFCKVCGLPPEYCEYGLTLDKCKQSLKDNEPDLYGLLYSGASNEETSNVDAKAVKKAAEKLKKEEEKKNKSRITIKRIERNKRKYITSVAGLEVFNIDLKKAAKLFANKFACGSSVSKTPTGSEEIVVQGDVSDELLELITKTWKEIDEEKIDLKEDKKNKKGAQD